MDAYAYASDGGGMVLLLLLLGAIFSYLFFSKGFWLDKWARNSKDERWDGSDIGETPFKINDARLKNISKSESSVLTDPVKATSNGSWKVCK